MAGPAWAKSGDAGKRGTGMLTIAICTYDRSPDVRTCMAKLHPQIDFASAELLLVDSGSSPAEAWALERIAADRPGTRYMRVQEPGVSKARNAALREARGDWIAFLDDDAIPAHDWFANVMRLVAKAPARCGVIGGNITPLFPPGHAPTFGRRWQQYLSLVDQPDEDFAPERVAVCGVNAAYRRSFLLEAGGFPETLGRVRGLLLSGEEKYPHELAPVIGWQVGRSDRLRVRHRIPAERLRRRWVVRRAFWDGRSDERIFAILRASGNVWTNIDLAGRLVVLGLLYPILPCRQEFFLRFWYTLGRLRERLDWMAGAALRPAITGHRADTAADAS